MKLLFILSVLLLSGCASKFVTGLPSADAQLRVFEGSVDNKNSLLSPIEGFGTGCVTSIVGTIPTNVTVDYDGQTCDVTANKANEPEPEKPTDELGGIVLPGGGTGGWFFK